MDSVTFTYSCWNEQCDGGIVEGVCKEHQLDNSAEKDFYPYSCSPAIGVYLCKSCLKQHHDDWQKLYLQYKTPEVIKLLKHCNAAVEEGRNIATFVKLKFDQKSINAKVEDFAHSLQSIRQRLFKNGTQGDFEVVSDIGRELEQFLQNLTANLMNKETFLILFKLKLGISEQKQPHVIEEGEEGQVTLIEENTDEETQEVKILLIYQI